MTHEEYRTQLSALLDGELADGERGAALAHLARCEACRTYFAELNAMHDAFGDMELIDAPAGFAAGVLARLREEATPRTAKKRVRRRTWGALAACAAVAALALAASPRPGKGSGSAGGAAPPSVRQNATTATPATPAAAPEAPETYEFTDEAAEDAADYGETAPASADKVPLEDEALRRAQAGELPALKLTGEGAADWLAENAEPLGGGRWLVTVEAAEALPDTLALVAVGGLQEPVDGTLVVTLGTTENPR